MDKNEYRVGVNRGLPVGMGYFSVSFGFGAMAVSQGLKTLDAVLISATNLTSAGQFAGLTLIVAAATLWEMVLTQLVINSRYALMSLALSQRMGEKIGLLPRLLIAFFNTDEIFALAMAREAPLTVPFLLGLGTLPFIGWAHWPGRSCRSPSGRRWGSCSTACSSPSWCPPRRRTGMFSWRWCWR